jgi:hypothetical protein
VCQKEGCRFVTVLKDAASRVFNDTYANNQCGNYCRCSAPAGTEDVAARPADYNYNSLPPCSAFSDTECCRCVAVL